MNAPVTYSLDQQIVCLMREISMRETCYPKWIAQKKMLQAKADHEIGAMRAALNTLTRIKENGNA